MTPGPVASAQAAVANYYADTLARHGATPAGVDWGTAAGQELRYGLLLRLCDFSAPFSLNDVGCGYGALLGILRHRWPGASVDYLGSDLSAAMVARARRRWPRSTGARFVQDGAAPRVADYAVASGIFNVVPPGAAPVWDDVVATTLADMRASTRRGFAVNFMAASPNSPPLPGCQPESLYRCDPTRWIAHCERALACSAALLAGYALNEFTLLVRPRD